MNSVKTESPNSHLNKELLKLKEHLSYFSALPAGRVKKASFDEMSRLLTGLRSREEWLNVLGQPGSFVGLSPENFAFRDSYTHLVGFCLLTQELIAALAVVLKDRKTIEIGCGTGDLAYHLLKHNPELDLRAFDIDLQESKYGFEVRPLVIQGDGPQVLTKEKGTFDTVLMSWPCYQSDFAINSAKAMPIGSTLIHCFEDCTGTPEFYEYLTKNFEQAHEATNALNFAHLQFPGIHDLWGVCVKTR